MTDRTSNTGPAALREANPFGVDVERLAHNHPIDERFVVEGCPACPWPPETFAPGVDGAWEALHQTVEGELVRMMAGQRPSEILENVFARHRPLIEAALRAAASSDGACPRCGRSGAALSCPDCYAEFRASSDGAGGLDGPEFCGCCGTRLIVATDPTP